MKEYTILLRGFGYSTYNIRAESFIVDQNVCYFLRKKTVDELSFQPSLETLSVAIFPVQNSAIVYIRDLEV